MRLFQTFQIRRSKLKAAGESFERAEKLLEQLGAEDVFFGFHLANLTQITGQKYSPACQRVLKAYPQLAAYANEQANLISNMAEGIDRESQSTEQRATIQPLLSEIAKGIPRRFSFAKATIVIDGIPWLGTAPGPHTGPKYASSDVGANFDSGLPYDLHSSCIIIRDDWWYPKRERHLIATIEREMPAEEAAEIPPLPAATRELIESLGPVQHEEFSTLSAKASVGNPHRVAGRSDVEKMQAELESLPLPQPDYAPPPRDYSPFSVHEFDLKVHEESPKKVLLSYFRPLKYRYVSSLGGQGGYFLQKLTPANNLIELFFDMGSRYDNCTAFFEMRGPDWEVGLSLWPPEEEGTGDIHNTEAWRKICENILFRVEYLEQNWVPQVEERYGPAPKWYQYPK